MAGPQEAEIGSALAPNSIVLHDSCDDDMSRFSKLLQSMVRMHQTLKPDDPFVTIARELELEHQREVEAAKASTSTISRRGGKGQGGLMVDTKRTLPQRIRKSSADTGISFFTTPASAWDDDEQMGPLWQLSRPDRERRGGEKHVKLEKEADELREANSLIEAKVLSITSQMKEMDATLLPLLEQLKPEASASTADRDGIRREITGTMQEMEKAYFKLSDLRSEEVRNLEAIRGLKMRIWRLLGADKIETTLHDIEGQMRDPSTKRFGRRKHTELRAAELEMRELSCELESQLQTLLQEALCLLSSTNVIEKKLSSKLCDDVWAVCRDSEPLIAEISKNNWQLRIMSWRLTHMMTKKMSALRKLDKIRRAETILARQDHIQKILASGNKADIEAKVTTLERLTAGINDEIVDTASSLREMTRESDAVRLKLAEMKHIVSDEVSALRDRVLTLIHNVELEDMRLAWLRKEQLQLMELHEQACHALASPDEQGATKSSSH